MTDLRRHVGESRISLSKTEGKVRVENQQIPTGAYLWDVHFSPDEARKFGRELIRLADEIDSKAT